MARPENIVCREVYVTNESDTINTSDGIRITAFQPIRSATDCLVDKYQGDNPRIVAQGFSAKLGEAQENRYSDSGDHFESLTLKYPIDKFGPRTMLFFADVTVDENGVLHYQQKDAQRFELIHDLRRVTDRFKTDHPHASKYLKDIDFSLAVLNDNFPNDDLGPLSHRQKDYVLRRRYDSFETLNYQLHLAPDQRSIYALAEVFEQLIYRHAKNNKKLTKVLNLALGKSNYLYAEVSYNIFDLLKSNDDRYKYLNIIADALIRAGCRREAQVVLQEALAYTDDMRPDPTHYFKKYNEMDIYAKLHYLDPKSDLLDKAIQRAKDTGVGSDVLYHTMIETEGRGALETILPFKKATINNYLENYEEGDPEAELLHIDSSPLALAYFRKTKDTTGTLDFLCEINGVEKWQDLPMRSDIFIVLAEISQQTSPDAVARLTIQSMLTELKPIEYTSVESAMHYLVNKGYHDLAKTYVETLPEDNRAYLDKLSRDTLLFRIAYEMGDMKTAKDMIAKLRALPDINSENYADQLRAYFRLAKNISQILYS